jgi:RNA polymerase sigma-70 factor (ECF subfamily)
MASRKSVGSVGRKETAEDGAPKDKGSVPETEPDTVLVDRLKNGDRQASEELIRRYQDKAYAVAYRMLTGDREAALDLTQEAFLNALRSIEKFEGRSSFYTWFYRILINTCLDSIRRRKRRRQFFFLRQSDDKNNRGPSDAIEQMANPQTGSTPGAVVTARELQREIRVAMGLLSVRQRMIFNLKVFEEMRISEIARIMGLAEGTVKSHLFRATRIMRDALADWSGH